MSILFLIESPGKIKKISSILGKGYIVKASAGHFRDLDPKAMSIDFDRNFEPIYVITKPNIVRDLKSVMKSVDMVYLASDADLEGEQIAQSLYDVLKPKKYKRLIFNSITKKAIQKAITEGGVINKDLVSAQKTRRVLDRLVGFLISPIVQGHVSGGVSAGRVQSVAARIIIDRENEIKKFMKQNEDSCHFKVHGVFSGLRATLFECEKNMDLYKGKSAQLQVLDDIDQPNKKVILFLKRSLKSIFTIHSVSDRMTSRSAAPPFTTSTLQQEANRKFGMPVDLTMKTAQKLYEGGFITYMRTDSVEISAEGQADIKKVIEKEFGKEFYQKNVYRSKTKNAQEAHEAIRPTHADLLSLDNEVDNENQIKLYKLIWQRTIASQMKPAEIKVYTVQIDISAYSDSESDSKLIYYFQGQAEEIIFKGFMIVYIESKDDVEEEDPTAKKEQLDTFLKLKLHKGQTISMDEIVAKLEYLRPPPRFTEASLVKKLEAMGIGRPSTFVSTVKTIQDRNYVAIGNVPGTKKDITTYRIHSKNHKHVMDIAETSSTILLGKENKKMIPTDLGFSVNDFLVKNFPEIMDYEFTAKLEADMDDIGNGNKIWHKVVKKFYDKLKPIVDSLTTTIKPRNFGTLLGSDSNGIEIFSLRTRKGIPIVKKIINDKPIYADVVKPLTLENIKLKDAIKLLDSAANPEFPKTLGQHQKFDVQLRKGKFGVYLWCNSNNYPIPTDIDAENITLKQALKIIDEKDSKKLGQFEIIERKKPIKVLALKGDFGPYLAVFRGTKKTNYKIPSNINPKKLTVEIVSEIINPKKTGAKKVVGSKTSKKSTAKKSTTKKPALKKPTKNSNN